MTEWILAHPVITCGCLIFVSVALGAIWLLALAFDEDDWDDC